MYEDIEELNNKIDERIKKIVPNYLQSSAFMDRKLTDTPTDDLQVTSRRYVTMNGISSNRPRSSVIGQFYYDRTIGRPIWWDGTSFKDAAGSVT